MINQVLQAEQAHDASASAPAPAPAPDPNPDPDHEKVLAGHVTKVLRRDGR